MELIKIEHTLHEALTKCEGGDTIAFKEIDRKQWFTGIVNFIYPPNSEYNKRSEYVLSIRLSIPVEPQFYEDEKTTFTFKDISNLIILEKAK